MPIYSAFVLFVILANVGFPGLSGFIPEFMILTASISSISPATYFILAGMIVTTAAGLITGLRLLFGAVKVGHNDGNFVDVTYLEFSVAISLCVSIVVLGLYNILI